MFNIKYKTIDFALFFNKKIRRVNNLSPPSPSESTETTAAFNAAARQPALRFELQTGLSDIAGRYIFPEGHTARSFEEAYTWRFTAPVTHPHVVVAGNMPDRGMIEAAVAVSGFGGIIGGIDAVMDDFSPAYTAELKKAWQQLVALNPPLSAIDTGGNRALYNAFCGVVSGFNVDDIIHFITPIHAGKDSCASLNRDFTSTAMRREIEEKTNVRLNWLPAPVTMRRMLTQIYKKQKPV